MKSGYFLSWPPATSERLALNAMVLAECTFLFARLFTMLLDYMEPRPSWVGVMTILENLDENGHRAILRPEVRHVAPYVYTTGPEAPENEATFANLIPGTLPEGRIAFELLAPVYEWFSIDHDQIPYTQVCSDGTRSVTVESLIAV
jgi:hypothetical protein